jgi:signal transduction histidine kinase
VPDYEPLSDDDYALNPHETTLIGASASTQEISIQRQAKLVMLGGETPGRIFLLRDVGETVIGRDPSVDIRLGVADISRRHARLICGGEHHYALEDLGSRNGTLHNGVPVTAPQRLRYGDRLQFGAGCSCVFTYHDQADAQLAQLQKLDAVGQLASSLAHDFGNMLFVLGNCLTALDEEEDPAERVEIRSDMRQAVDRGRTLTRQLLDVARRDDLELAKLDLREVVNGALDLFRHTLDDRPDLDLCHQLESVVIEGNQGALQQAMLNLLLNARDAMPDGGEICVELRISRPTATSAALLPSGALACLVIRDNGVGMEESTRQRIFEPFFTTKARGKGTGLGLASAFSTVRGHGGQIEVESALGCGTVFRIYLPLSAGNVAPKTLYGVPKVGV